VPSIKESIMLYMYCMYCLLQNLATRRPFKSEDGVTAIEYGLIAALIAVAVITAVALVGTNLGLIFTNISGKLTT
jgi:pilus assembly protein Flp/PilA